MRSIAPHPDTKIKIEPIIMKSPDGKYEVVMHGHEEVRMGSPEFGEIEIRGAAVDTSGRFGTEMAFSPDSRFLVIEQLMSTASGPLTRAVVFDLKRRVRVIVDGHNEGFFRRFAWSADGMLSYVTWSHLAGEREYSWRPPSP